MEMETNVRVSQTSPTISSTILDTPPFTTTQSKHINQLLAASVSFTVRVVDIFSLDSQCKQIEDVSIVSFWKTFIVVVRQSERKWEADGHGVARSENGAFNCEIPRMIRFERGFDEVEAGLWQARRQQRGSRRTFRDSQFRFPSLSC